MREYLINCGFKPMLEGQEIAWMSYFTFVAFGNMIRIVIIQRDSIWEIKEIFTTGKIAFDLVNKHVPNYDVLEAAIFIENIGHYSV